MEAKQRFLHGTLEATIFHATPYTPPFPFNCILANGKPTYVTIRINNKMVARTSHERDRLWNQTFHVLCAHPSDSTITIALETSCSVLGKIHFQATQFLDDSGLIHGFFPLEPDDNKSGPKQRLQLILWFKPVGVEPGWEKLISGGGHYKGLQNCSFPQRSNCHVSLYQDAHHMSSFRPPNYGLCKNENPNPRRLWEDVFKAIEGSKYFVYIAGWSLNPKLVLVRDTDTDIPHAVGVTLGELLKRKAEDGVAVRIMLWDDETSLPHIKNKGVMGTHDEDASAYFRHDTKVVCKLCPRLHHKFPTVFAHHQKTITVDTQSHFGSADREVMSFIGGLDLCDGRYDTEEHSLFRTLDSDFHSHDFYQTNIAGTSLNKGGPRVPWHDTHSCVRGEVAWDVMTNFEQRWVKQCGPNLLLPARTISGLARGPSLRPNHDYNWNVQVFRSIDHISATQLPKNLRVEQTIHEAYIDAIRRAERFVYIENQYFIGGCHLWEKDSHSGCTNLIPVEIALKVASKIKAKERFAVYVVIPMWPEGVPMSESVQDILHWTRETMQMMYRLIGEAIRESGGHGHPRDYLNFFCLANREERRDGELKPPSSPRRLTQYWNSQKHRRFMVYVHSKLMIVDDVYLIIGSANINQRSMDGQRDTEIAIGCYQKDRHGDVQAYRMSLWYEHTNEARELFLEPESSECVNRVRSIGDKMWKIYSEEDMMDMEGVHLVSYPIHVKEDGCIEEVGGGTFPDTKAPVRGRRSRVLTPIITT